jgi:hypothetical protein
MNSPKHRLELSKISSRGAEKMPFYELYTGEEYSAISAKTGSLHFAAANTDRATL